MYVYSSDRCPLKNPEGATAIQHNLVDLLHDQITKSHPEDKFLFANILSFLADMRVATEMHAEQSQKVKLIVSELDIPVPPLMMEMST